jgi:N-methylhydantoinase A/oxoprolinase/acetone carboxylase beta subunit
MGLNDHELLARVVEQVVDRVALEIIDKLVVDTVGHGLLPSPAGWSYVLERVLGHGDDAALDCRIQARQPIVAIGAPVSAFVPRVAEKLHTRCVIPPYAEVGNAVGAVVASVTHTVEVLVQPRVQGAGTLTFLVHGPAEREVFNHYPEAVTRAEEVAVRSAREAVRRAGGEVASVKLDRHEVELGRLSEMTVRVTATGRPSRHSPG